jgi:hypothetical protein
MELEQSLRNLNTLAIAEYRQSLAEVVTCPGDNDETRLLRIGRLLGVLLKLPFAIQRDLATPSATTRAYRAYDLKSVEDFGLPDAIASWEYQALEALRSNADVVQSLGWQPHDVYSLAYTAQSERGFFWFLAMSCRKYLCRESKIREEVERSVKEARRAGVDIKNVTPELVVQSGGFAIGAALVQAIPALGIMGAPVIAGLVFILYSIGIDAFCQWSKDHESYHANFPNADAN